MNRWNLDKYDIDVKKVNDIVTIIKKNFTMDELNQCITELVAFRRRKRNHPYLD